MGGGYYAGISPTHPPSLQAIVLKDLRANGLKSQNRNQARAKWGQGPTFPSPQLNQPLHSDPLA